MIREAKKSVLRNVEDFLRKDIMEVVREMSVDRPLPRQMMRTAVASGRPSINTGNVRPTPVKGKLLYFPSKRQMGA